MAKRNIFNRVPVRRVKRAGFDLSNKILTTMEMGKLYPVGAPILAIPGDKHKLGHQVVAHAMPMGAPAFADITMYFLDFFVPFRILYPDIDEHLFERFISNELLDNGETAVLPRMNATDVKSLASIPSQYTANNYYSQYDSLWDYFGFQTGVKPRGLSAPLDAPWRAYWLIYNEFIRDEKLEDKKDWSAFAHGSDYTNLEMVQPACVNYARDYLTSAFLSPQQGDAVSLPLSGYAPIVGDYNVYSPHSMVSRNGELVPFKVGNPNSSGFASDLAVKGVVPNNEDIDPASESVSARVRTEEWEDGYNFASDSSDLGPLRADLTSASTYDINDLRLANALQRWKEINNRCGTRYAEFLRAQYGVAPRDERLQRPEFIGGTKCPIIVSQVLQTSNSDSQESPTGFKYGQGMAVDSDYSGTYFVKEFGLIMTLAYIRPKTLYQDGITREWTPETYLDFMNPLYVGLGEQGIKNSEVFAVDDETENRKIWGYQAMYQELRYRSDRVTGKMRSNLTTGMSNSFDYWHLGRHFESLPQLNVEFIKCKPSTRIFQAGNTEIQFICEIGNSVKSLRPLPYYAVPRF